MTARGHQADQVVSNIRVIKITQIDVLASEMSPCPRPEQAAVSRVEGGYARPDMPRRVRKTGGGPNRGRSARTPSRTQPGLNGLPPSPAAAGRALTG